MAWLYFALGFWSAMVLMATVKIIENWLLDRQAALIAAAPELLQALHNLVKMTEDGDLTSIELDEAKAVIAKAEGR